jgi:polyferredoxin
VMKKIKKAPNLIRFDSVQGIESGIRSVLNGRTYAYSAVLAVLIIILAITIGNRKPIEATILRVSGSIYQQVDSVTYSNLYMVKIINKTQSDKELHIHLLTPESGKLQLTTGQSILKNQGILESVLIVNLNKQSLTGKSTPIELGIFDGDTLLEKYTTNFLGPEK